MSSSTAAPLLPAGGTTRPLQQAPSLAAGAGAGGSYTPVFVVLGVIAALLVISCLVGQVCTRKHLRPRPRRDRVAYYDDDDDGMEGGFGGPLHPHHGGIAKMEAPAPAASVETRPSGAASAAAAVQQTAA
ncbi:hypothetical protein ZEAMMB73_Zm00001d039055 [Zea mays]|jgi:hypothetical protein|uniref:Uncharacterized protein n=1 Tax=Zea mays TaxID=4577 RepID=A0A1D6MD72_MAIZE|nr:hypothetical protein ZEAMMB73_Zm00001d039055 [Zea mays]